MAICIENLTYESKPIKLSFNIPQPLRVSRGKGSIWGVNRRVNALPYAAEALLALARRTASVRNDNQRFCSMQYLEAFNNKRSIFIGV
jgi:hypothetical protein